MSESCSLSYPMKGIVKFKGKAECVDDWKERVYINIRIAKGYERVRKILNGNGPRN